MGDVGGWSPPCIGRDFAPGSRPFRGPGGGPWGRALTAAGLPSPSIGGGAFLASVAPPCFPGAGVVLAPVESLDEGGGLTVGALASIAESYSPVPACQTVQLLLPDCHSIIETPYDTLPHHQGEGSLVSFSSAGFELPFDIPYQLAAHVAVLVQ